MALMFLNGDGMRDGPAHHHIAGSPLAGERRTAPCYRFYSVRDEFPGLYPGPDGGQAILGELYDVPMTQLRDLLGSEPPELELSIVELEGGELSFGMVLRRAEYDRGIHKDITRYGSWRQYLSHRDALFSWPGGADLAPEVLYERASAHPVRQPARAAAS